MSPEKRPYHLDELLEYKQIRQNNTLEEDAS